MPQKVGKKVGIHCYENVLSEINLPLLDLTNVSLFRSMGKAYIPMKLDTTH